MADFTPPKPKHQFWVCPCFTDDPAELLESEGEVVDYLFNKSRKVMVDQHVCLNRRLSVYVQLLARCAAEIPLMARAEFDAQVSDYLSGFLDKNPSK